jgi:predicted transcriptional regulator
MKKKTSITLSVAVLEEVDRLAGSDESRSAFIERVLRGYFRRRARRAINRRDLERLNRGGERINAEAADALGHQAPWSEE